MKKKRALVISSFPAPYRVDVFNELRKWYDLDVFFSEGNNENRNTNWFPDAKKNNFSILSDSTARKIFLKSLVHIKKYDFIMPYDAGEKASILAIVLCRFLRIPYFINADGAILKKNLIRDFVKRFLYSGAAACFSSGKTADEYFINYGVDKNRLFRHTFTSLCKADILNSPLSVEEKKNFKRRLNLPDKTIVLSVGRFIPIKGYMNLINAWRNVKNAELLIIGGGEEKRNYENEIDRLGINSITICDFLSKDELKLYYYAADIFVLPTLGDVWGLVINEAMACGLPIVTTYECVAGRELINDGINGYLVQAEDTLRMSGKMQILIDDSSLRSEFGARNLEIIRDATIDRIADCHHVAIEKTLKKCDS